MRNKKYILSIILLSYQLLANTSDWRNNRLLPLEKVTVGPYDNYQSSLQSEKNLLYFTRHENQISQIYVQDLKTGKSKRLLRANIDAKDPAISPDHRWLAMTKFDSDAQGDIYLYPLDKKEKAISLSNNTTQDSSPFWINAKKIGYIQESMMSDVSQLVTIDIYTKEKKVLVSGNISAASANGRYIVFHKQTKEKSQSGVYIYDLQKNQQLGPFRIELPGSSSYAYFGSDSKYLYFAHYLNDTSADQNIDGKDHSVVFRVKVSNLLNSDKTVIPQQLTSVDQNCNFPLPTSKYLYLTCAYEGSLDIYRMALSGRVPLKWNKEQIIQAHQNSTSYEDRLLLLNALKFRFYSKENNRAEKISLLEEQLSNHLEINEYSAANYFVKNIEALYKEENKKSLAEFYHNLSTLLALNSDALKQPQGKITRAFKLELEQNRKKLLLHSRASGGALFNAWIDTLLGDNSSALKELNEVWQYKKEFTPLAYYLAVKLSSKLLKKRPKLLLARLLDASQNDSLPSQSRLYYAFEYLNQLSIIEPDLHKRVSLLMREIKNKNNKKNLNLFVNELTITKMIMEKEESKKRKIFSQLIKDLKNISDPLMRDTIHKRAILLLKSTGNYKFMELLSRHWLTVANNKNIGFYDIAQQYSIITMNKAYGILGSGDIRGATGAFYSAIRQTNDLEALYNFTILGLTSENSALKTRTTKALTVLEKAHLLQANKKFLKALQLLIADPKESKESLKQATLLLEDLQPTGLTPALKNLLLGYLYHRELLRSKKNYKYDKELYKKAHYRYMLALDQAYDNERIQAAVLENLGQLHFGVGNYFMAKEFFAKRLAIPFLNKQNEALFRGHYARSLFYYNDFIDAAKEGEMALKLAQELKMKNSLAFMQQSAFYNIYAMHYKRAVTLYKKILKDKNLQGMNRAKALLGYGYTLLQLHHPALAAQQFKELIIATSQDGVSFEPERLQLLAYGFLVSSSSNPEEKIYYLSQRIKILRAIKERIQDFAYDEKSRLEFLIKALEQMAVAYKENEQLQEMKSLMSKALELLPKYLAQNGGYNSQVVIRTLNNYMLLALLYPQEFKNSEPVVLQPLVEKTIQALTLSGYTPPITSMEKFKLEILKTTYDIKVTGKARENKLQKLLLNLKKDPKWSVLKNKHSKLFKEIEKIIYSPDIS